EVARQLQLNHNTFEMQFVGVPVMRGSFNLYRSQLRVFLTTHEVWGHLNGGVVRDPADAALQAQLDARDLIVRDALLRSVSTSDAARICSGVARSLRHAPHHQTRSGPATRVARVLKHGYDERRACEKEGRAGDRTRDRPHFEHGQSMEQWLQERRNMRQQLTNMGYPMTDDQLVDVILTNVAKTHRDLVRQFAKTTQMAGAPGRPTLAHVMNTLLAETELDEALSEEKPAPPVPKVMRVSGRRASPGDRGSASGGIDANNQKSKPFKARRKGKCHYCHKPGHWARECRKRRFDAKFQSMLKKRNKKDKRNEADDDTSFGAWAWTPPGVGMTRMQESSHHSPPGTLEWLLDTCSIAHVCADPNAMHDTRAEDGVGFEVWTGATSHGSTIAKKSECVSLIINCIRTLLAAGHRVQFVASDQGTEFMTKTFHEFLQPQGIRPLWTNVYTPEENSLVERVNHVLLSKVQTTLVTADLPDVLWAEALMWVVHVDNASPTKSLGGRTPFEVLNGKKPNWSTDAIEGKVDELADDHEHKK
ncbi:TPA: LOW QUALITY PROTEIN: hypothetical protein N0F65_003552, partial [Lagenidium giganteum]